MDKRCSKFTKMSFKKKKISFWYKQILNYKSLRVSTADVPNVPNAKYLAHLTHQTQKRSFIRCAKCVKLLQHWTVTLQFATIWTNMAFAFIIFLFNFSLSSHFFNWFFLSPHNQSLSPNQCSFLFRSDSQLLPQPQTSFSLFAPQIKPKNLLSSLFAPQIKLQFPVQNKTQKWNHHKPNRSSSYQRKNKGIGE